MRGEYYTAKVKLRIDGVVHEPGSVLDESILPDPEYFLKKGYVSPPLPVADPAGLVSGWTAPDPAVLPDDEGGGEPEDEDDGELEFLTEEGLKKLGSKAAIVEYAEKIGLPGLDVNEHKTELIDHVLAYMDGVMKDDL